MVGSKHQKTVEMDGKCRELRTVITIEFAFFFSKYCTCGGRPRFFFSRGWFEPSHHTYYNNSWNRIVVSKYCTCGGRPRFLFSVGGLNHPTIRQSGVLFYAQILTTDGAPQLRNYTSIVYPISSEVHFCFSNMIRVSTKSSISKLIKKIYWYIL